MSGRSQSIMQSRKILLILALEIFMSPFINAQKSDPPFLKYMNHPWVDSVLNSLTTEERVAQLIWIAAFSNRDLGYDVDLSNQIKKTGIGGVIFFQGQAEKQAEMINYFRQISKVPPIIVTDGEWGLGMRLDGVEKFPYQMTLGAIQNDSLVYKMGKGVAAQFRRAGVQINLAPVADVNNNPGNPVINFRSFGEDPENAGKKALMYMKGLQDNGIISVAKHFPGHGDSEIDSHIDLPVIRHSRTRLDTVELYPFRSLIDAGVTGIMPGHLSVPSIDSTLNLPSTLSYPVLSQLLKNELSFKGLVISDAMNMGGVTKYSDQGEAEVMALKAGMDVLEYVTNPEKTIKTIIEKINKGEILLATINEKCRKVLATKYWAGLNNWVPVAEDNLLDELSPTKVKAQIRELYAYALTVLNNDLDIIPVRNLEKNKIATIAINGKEISSFQQRISNYLPADNYIIDPAN